MSRKRKAYAGPLQTITSLPRRPLDEDMRDDSVAAADD